MDRKKYMYSKSQNNNALFYNVETSFYGISAIYKKRFTIEDVPAISTIIISNFV